MADLGSDFGGIDDLDANLTFVSGRRCLIEALACRLVTDKGALFDDPTYGEPILDLIGEGGIDFDVLAGKIEDQFLADERVEEATVEASFEEKTRTATLKCTVKDGDGPFDFTLNVSDLTVEIFEET